jgi:hypothetical protein
MHVQSKWNCKLYTSDENILIAAALLHDVLEADNIWEGYVEIKKKLFSR